MSQKPDAKAFLSRLGVQPEIEDEPKPRSAVPKDTSQQPTAEVHALPPAPAARTRKTAAKTKPRRAELKHFGGYLDDDTLEKIALLRIRLKKDNSELITFAIEELHRKHNAKRAFGDN